MWTSSMCESQSEQHLTASEKKKKETVFFFSDCCTISLYCLLVMTSQFALLVISYLVISMSVSCISEVYNAVIALQNRLATVTCFIADFIALPFWHSFSSLQGPQEISECSGSLKPGPERSLIR